jgi:hypothetical protein
MHQSFSTNPDTLILQEAIKAFSTSNGSCMASLITSLFSKIPKLFLFIGIKKLIESSSTLFDPITKIVTATLVRLLYTKAIYKNKDVYDIEYHICRELKNQKFTLEKLTPAIRITDYNTHWECEYIRGFHSMILNQIVEKAREEHAECKKNIVTQTVLFKKLTGSAYKNSVFNNLYPSKNYKLLEGMITKYFVASSLLGTSDVLGILIDGVPGLGKTKFADYACQHKLVDEIYKIDMSNFVNRQLTDILNVGYFSIDIKSPKTIFVIDELDKYLDYRLLQDYETKKKEYNKEKNIVLESYAEFVKLNKVSYLYEILGVLERDDTKFPIVVLFFSNNFATIFDGIDVTHHKSLYSRFMKVTFEKCDTEEIANYIDYYNKKFENTEMYCNIRYDEILRRLDDLSLTHRELHHISIEAMYNAEKMIELIGAYVPVQLVTNNITKEESSFYQASNENITNLCNKKIPTENKDKTLSSKQNKNQNTQPKSHEDESFESESDEDQSFDSKDYRDINCGPKEDPDQFPVHKEIWQKEFIDSLLTNKNHQPLEESISKILDYLGKINKVPELGQKLCHLTELFDYIAITPSALMLIDTDNKFKNTIANKILEYVDTGHFSVCSTKTKQFIYALTGKQA